MNRLISTWTVDYGDGPKEISVPHAWRQDVPVGWEGPATYRASVEVPYGDSRLHFAGVSYCAKISIDGNHALTHQGMWDSFELPLGHCRGKTVEVTVEVTKNGGPAFPVRDVASGFLPYVFNTFGGIHGEVELVTEPSAERQMSAPRVRLDGSKIYVDDRPFYMRGVLSWGWYPEIGHTNPPEDVIRQEVQAVKAMGFNLVKFCLWVPSHRYLDILREEGMFAWLELPLWDPTTDPILQERIAQEMERIVRQYQHHDNIIVWTVGCELSASTSPDYRAYLYQMVKNLTGCPLVKDNSGGAEMYGGDLREFGDFYDFHPYCETPFYPPVLDSLLAGPRSTAPILLGEFNDLDVHRDVAKLHDQLPYWASLIAELNDQGVRWQHDLPHLLQVNRFPQEPTKNGHRDLMRSAREKALFVRKTVHEAVRARAEISGTVVTGLRDTPISSSGFFDDWDNPRFSAEECRDWNGDTVLFPIPNRQPPWVNGGNRPGWRDPFGHFPGQLFWRVGVHSDRDSEAGLIWRILDPAGELVARGACKPVSVPALESQEIGEITWDCQVPGDYLFEIEFANAQNRWRFSIVPPLDAAANWAKFDPAGLIDIGFTGSKGLISTRFVGSIDAKKPTILFLTDEGTLPSPFWREATYEFNNADFWARLAFKERWEKWLAISPDRSIDPEWLAKNVTHEYETLMNRIDVRTYKESPVLVRHGSTIITTIRPWGGLGIQPTSLSRNPFGCDMLSKLMKELDNS